MLKRRKKYRRLPLRREDDNTASDESLEEDDRPELREIINDSFEKLPPLRAKYKTSDSIRMNRQIVPDNLSRYSKSSQTISQNNRDNQGKIKSTNYNPRKTPEAKHHVELSDKFRFKQKIKEPRKSSSKYFEQVGAESREEKVYRPYFDDDDDDVLVASGYHNTISIQEPLSNGVSLQDPAAYDFTIGKIIIILGLTVEYFLPWQVTPGQLWLDCSRLQDQQLLQTSINIRGCTFLQQTAVRPTILWRITILLSVKYFVRILI